jgi:hypothetical protein
MMRPSSVNLRALLSLLLVTGFIAGLTLPSIAFTRDRQVVHAAPQSASALDVIINEVAWAGTAADPADEWIELYNPGSTSIDLTNWQLISGDASPNIVFGDLLNVCIPDCSIPAEGYFLLERDGDDTVSDVTANLIYSGELFNIGETLTLFDDSSNPIDFANSDGGDWPAGGLSNLNSMERIAVAAENSAAWRSNDGCTKNGTTAAGPGNPIYGTPKQRNSQAFSSLDLVINEVAWAGTLASDDDEWIELYNPTSSNINLGCGWTLVADVGGPDISLSGAIAAGGYFLLERLRQQVTDVTADQIYSGSLDDAGEVLRLRAPDGSVIDTANVDSGSWPAGSVTSTGSMERMDDDITGNPLPDALLAWVTNVQPGASLNHYDAAHQKVQGTPKEVNWGFSVTHTPTPTPAGALSLLINEVAWMGTAFSSTDEWIELYNPGSQPVDLTNWRLYSSTDNIPNIVFSASNCVPDCIVPAGGYFVIGSNADAFNDGVHASLIPDYVISFSLNNEGEVLRLVDPGNAIVDTANSDGGAWPAGVGSPTYASMERRGTQTDGFFAWSTYSNPANSETPAPPPYPSPLVYDHGGSLIKGTPGQANWGLSVTQTPTFTATPPRTATPTRTPTKRPTATAYLSRLILINEFLPRPGSDWNHDGQINVYDEFIEIINADSVDINLKGWQLDDAANAGSDAFVLPDKVLKPGQRAVYYGLQSNILLSDGGDTVRLIRSNGEVADVQEYKFARLPDVSECQYPEGPGYFGVWRQDCFPTPGTANKLTGDLPPAPEGLGVLEPTCLLPDTLLEAFKLAECNGYGGNMWNAWYWDKNGWGPGKNVEQNNNQWGAWVD